MNKNVIFQIDLRSLAAFRIGLGFLILLDLMKRSLALRAHYTDAGILPRQSILDQVHSPIYSHLHFLGGSYSFQVTLFCLAGLLAVLLVVGFQTRVVTFFSWIFLMSLQRRNILVNHTGDEVLAILLFWGIFLPLGARFSWDARRQDPKGGVCGSWGSIGLILQIVIIYMTTAIWKWREPVWRQGKALFLTLNIESYADLFGIYLSHDHSLTMLLNYLSVATEFFVPLLFFSPYRNASLRLVAIMILALFQLGVYLCFSIGLFQPMMVVATLVFVPSAFWAKWEKNDSFVPAPAAWQIPAFFSVLLMIYFNGLNLSGLARPPLPVVNKLAYYLRLDQRWGMFTNVTNFPNGWFLAVGTHTDGRRVELLTGKPIDQWQKPVPYSSVFPNHNWRRYWVQLVSPRSAVFHADLGRYLCRNPPVINNPANSLREIEILYIGYEFTKTFRKREQKPRKLLHYSCPSLPT